MKKEFIFITIISFVISVILGLYVNFLRYGQFQISNLISALVGGVIISGIIIITYFLAVKFKK